MPRTNKPAPRVVIFAGPNGAGKSTHADAILAALGIDTFVSADYVKLRVPLGGHDVPSEVIRRRFGRSLNNFFKLYAPLADQWALFDNSSTAQAIYIAAQIADQLTVTEATLWRKLQKFSKVV